MMNILIATLTFALGFGAMWLIRLVVRRRILRMAEREAQDVLENAQLNADQLMAETKKSADELRDELREPAEVEIEQIEERICNFKEQIQDKIDSLESELNEKQNQYSRAKQQIDNFARKIEQQQAAYQAQRETLAKLKQDFVLQLANKVDTSAEEVTKNLTEKLENHAVINASKLAQNIIDEAQQSAERRAKCILTTALNRFARPYCPERGTGYVQLTNDQQKNNVLGQDNSNLKSIEQACGVDLVFNEENSSVSVSGFDPVRRELGRAAVEKIANERRFKPELIGKIVQRTKSELFAKIRKDGNRIAKELNLQNLHPEIRNMMGALRYRYSFTQNQHFHCGEVGFLCGLLSSELKLSMADGRRAGMLHDIGKAMDHSRDSGHAVIGADFIEQHGEEKHIVHAVRAHHYDEPPSTELAHLVIAADAISGARPGARRSTVVSYAQKMEDLQKIATSFNGVIDAHVVSAGREVRVYVDGRKVDDWGALRLSSDVATRIENEMAYPGQIKITVVRETQAVQYAK